MMSKDSMNSIETVYEDLVDEPEVDESEDTSTTPAPSTSTSDTLVSSFKFPSSRIRRLIKLDQHVNTVSSEAINYVSVAAELFCEYLAQQANLFATREKRKTLLYKDISRSVSMDKRLEFMQEIVPEQIPFARALELQKQQSLGVEEDEPMEKSSDQLGEIQNLSVQSSL